MPTKYESYIDAESGYNIVSTLDYKIQSTLDSYLEETFYENKVANRVCGIVMNVNTGAILAMGTYPNFDLNTPNQLDEWSLSQISQYGEGTGGISGEIQRISTGALEKQGNLVFI